MQDGTCSSTQMGSSPTPSTKSDDSSSITPPEAWGGERFSDKLTHHHQSVTLPSRFATLASSSLMSGSMFSVSEDLTLSKSQTSMSYQSSSSLSLGNLQNRDMSNQETSLGFSEHVPFSSASASLSQVTKSILGQSNLDLLGPALTLPRRYSTYAERISTTPALSDGTSVSVGSPKTKKTGAETREELLNSLLFRSNTSFATGSVTLPSVNVRTPTWFIQFLVCKICLSLYLKSFFFSLSEVWAWQIFCDCSKLLLYLFWL